LKSAVADLAYAWCHNEIAQKQFDVFLCFLVVFCFCVVFSFFAWKWQFPIALLLGLCFGGAFLFWVVFFVVFGCGAWGVFFTSCMGGMLGLAFVVVNAS
jgi:glucan phosphoethanolaminetransferase (alkaline phosphatase superfamily)